MNASRLSLLLASSCAVLLVLVTGGCREAPAETGASSAATKKPSARPTAPRPDGDDEEEEGITERRDPSGAYVPAPRAEALVFSDGQQRLLLQAARAG
ncbi:MAG: hypothetical protein Q8O67_28945, partial [Deltaproteobacteria bacterium]|nr:hypothetical protein [Deltaproteobacteria bacterium]